jgi:cytochrome c
LKIKLYMKKVFLALAIATTCYACGGGASTESTTPVSNNDSNANSQIGAESATPATPAPADTTAAAPATAAASGKDGKALIEGSDCRTCHLDKDKLVGPSYVEVARKYPNTDANVKLLASKIVAGGTGVWGQIPMVAHPNISAEDAEAMVKYVLSLK